MVIFINEWLPNPTGTDSKGEFVELFNSGRVAVSLRGWSLKTSGKKIVSLDGYTIAGNRYLLLKRTETKLALKNMDESLFLYDASGKLADHSSFLGTAQEGKSLSRLNYTTDTTEHFTWSDPTPGAVNKISENTEIAANQYPLKVPLNHPALSRFEICQMALAVAIVLAGIILYVIKHYENVSQLFFGRDEAIW
jgi:hypothetical protein